MKFMTVSKKRALSIIQELYSEIPSLKTIKEGDEKCSVWKHKTDNAIKQIFGNDSSEYNSIHLSLFPVYPTFGTYNFHDRLNSLCSKLKGFETAVELWDDDITIKEEDSVSILINMLSRFYKFALQLKYRHNQRKAIEMKDEYDVQDLLHGILKLHFNDVREEENLPSYAGSSSRVDFALKDEKILIEVKKTRPKLRDKELGHQLILDKEHYKKTSNYKTLICFIYDPDNFIKNPEGLKKDLNETNAEMNVIVVISPES